MKKNYLVLSFFLSIFITLVTNLFILTSPVFAQASDEEIAKKYEIVFPIKELGNCNSITSCKAFCDKQENQQVCIDYAKTKRFYQESISVSDEDKLLKLAEKEWGCKSQDECMVFCDTRDNWRKCADFAERNGLDGGRMQQMEKAMQQLGCDSPKSCMDYCSNPLNMPKCMQTFKNAGFEVGSSEPIEAWCPKQAQETGMTCVIEGGNTCVCTDSASGSSPKEWCEKDGGQWKDEICWFSEGGVFEPIESWCPKAGPNCEVKGDTCTCTEGPSIEELIESWCPKAGADCRVEKGQCVCGPTEPDQESCAKQGSNCKVEGNSCICDETPTVSSDEPIESWCPKAGADCRVEGESCICDGPENSTPTYGTPVYETPTYQTPSGEYSTPSYPSPESYSTIQGVKTTRGLLPLILDQISSFLSKL